MHKSKLTDQGAGAHYAAGGAMSRNITRTMGSLKKSPNSDHRKIDKPDGRQCPMSNHRGKRA